MIVDQLLSVCQDCKLHCETGNHNEYDEQFNNDQWQERKAQIERGLEQYKQVVDADETLGFCHTQCDICGTVLAGERYQFAELI